MSSFTAVALDRLIESEASKSMAPVRNYTDSKLERRHSTPISGVYSGVNAPNSKLERGANIPPKPKLEKRVSASPYVEGVRGGYTPYNYKVDRKNCDSASSIVDKTHHWTQISPALYTTPASTPLPDSPSSFPPSPYIINHKRRGPRLMKSFSEDDVALCERSIVENGNVPEMEIATLAKDDTFVSDELVDCNRDDISLSNGPGDTSRNSVGWDAANGSAGKNPSANSQEDGDVDDFVDPQESMSVLSFAESEGNGGTTRSMKSTTPIAEFYDAWEELSVESGAQLSVKDIENELREMQLSLSIEVEKRKQAEETLISMQNEWQRICEQLLPLGLTLPVDLTTLPDGDTPAAEVHQQVYLIRFVSNLIGRGTARAEVEMEMQAQISLKDFEIARLWDRLRYYETVNREMSQRNQEVVDTARRLRQKRKSRQKWVWGSIAAAITIGSAVIGWSYFHTGKGSSSSSDVHAYEADCKPK